jgi:DHA1 family bicyclomycin/chloramphenicol resistance-like MFS transporter
LLDPPRKPGDARAASRAPVRLLALLIAMTGVSSLSLNILVPAIPNLAAKLGTDPAHVQLTVSLYLMGLAVAQLVFGPLSDRFGRRPVVLSGLALATVASTSAIFAGSIAALVACRVLQSLGASTGQTIGRAIIRDLYERERAASMIGLVTSVVVVMPMAAPLIGGVLDTLFGWESIFIFSAALAGVVFVWTVLMLPETHRRARAAGAGGAGGAGARLNLGADLRALTTSPRFFGYTLCAGLGSGPFFSLLGGAPHVVVTVLGRTSIEYGLWFFVPVLGFMSGNFMVSRLAGRFGIDALIWWGIGLTILGCLINAALYLAAPGMAAIFVPHLVIGLGNGLLLPTAVAGAVSIRPQVAGTASGLTGFIQMSIGAAAAQLSGLLVVAGQGAMPMVLLMLFFGLAAAAAVFALVTWR